MKWAMTISLCVLVAAVAVAQNPSVIQSTRAAVSGQSGSPAPSNTAATTQTASGQVSAKATKSPKAAPVAKKSAKATNAEKTAAPKVEPAAEKKVGEIVATPAPTAADGTSPDQPASEKYSANGRRDPFVSPVVAQRAGGSGCTTGKKCLEIGSVNLRGVVHSDNGFIAVVSNSLNKAYFLRENDPVFNGYVVRITGDSIVFQETLQDRLGKTFTREVTKKITVPAV